jgi:hypothetical protein
MICGNKSSLGRPPFACVAKLVPPCECRVNLGDNSGGETLVERSEGRFQWEQAEIALILLTDPG